jgi:hypothetical protein
MRFSVAVMYGLDALHWGKLRRGGDAAPPDPHGYEKVLEPVAQREGSAPEAGHVMQAILAAIGDAGVFL